MRRVSSLGSISPSTAAWWRPSAGEEGCSHELAGEGQRQGPARPGAGSRARSVRAPGRRRRGRGRHAVGVLRLARSVRRSRADGARGPGRPACDRSGAPPEGRRGAPSRHRHHSRRGLRHRLLRHGQSIARSLVSGPRGGRRVRRVPPRPGGALSGPARGLLRRVALDLRPRAQPRHRQGAHRRLRAERRRWPGRRAGAAGP